MLISHKGHVDLPAQSGAVLVMALVMLTVLTLIGVSSMESSSLQLKIAANSQEHEAAFQAAQTIIAFVISEDPKRQELIDYHDISGATQTVTYPYEGSPIPVDDDNISGTAEITLVGCTAGIGDSLEEGKGQKFNFYNARVVGFNKSGSASSVQVQGVRYFAAGCG